MDSEKKKYRYETTKNKNNTKSKMGVRRSQVSETREISRGKLYSSPAFSLKRSQKDQTYQSINACSRNALITFVPPQ